MLFSKLYNKENVQYGVTKLGEIYLQHGDGSQIILTPDEVEMFYNLSLSELIGDGSTTLKKLVDWYQLLDSELFEEPVITFVDDDGVLNYITMDRGVLCTTTDMDDKDMYEPIVVTKDFLHKRYMETVIQTGGDR